MASTSVRIALLGLLVHGLAAAAARAQDGAAADGESWSVTCDTAGETARCTMLQNLVTQNEPQQRLLTVFVQTDPAGTRTLLLALPHGLFLPSGAQIQIDGGEATRLVIQTSDANGAYAGAEMTAELLAALRQGRTLTVTFQSAQRQTIAVPVTLSGFSAAYERLARGETPQ